MVKIVREWNLHGRTVGVDHGQGLESMYLHMSKFAVTEGATVKKGDVIGYVGSRGARRRHIFTGLCTSTACR